MEFIKRNVNKTQRNGQITIPKNVGVVNNSILSTIGGNYLPALANEDGSYTVDLTNVLFTGNLTAAGEVAAYKGGNSEGGNYVSVYDGLDSTDPSIALSANQGRILRELINNLSDEGLPTFLIDQLTLADELILKYDSEKQAWVNSDSIELDDYYNKEEVNTLIDDIKAGNVDLANYYTKSEIDTKIEEIDLSDYYTKSEIDSHTENTTIHITGSERSSWNGAVLKAHTHENKSVLDGISSTKVSKWDNTSTNFGDWFYKDSSGKVHSRYSFVGDSEISAHGSGEDESFTVIDNLLSTSTTSALSANQGRLLKLMIDNIGEINVDLSNYYNKSEVDKLIGDIQAGDIDLASYYNKTEINLLLQSYATVTNLTNLTTSLTNHTGDTTKHITATERTNWNTAYNNNHTHSNKTVLDGITSTKVSNWDTAYTNSHTHSNKAALDTITSTKINNWDLVVENWDNVFEINSDGDLLVKVNVIGELEISAYGAGESTGGGAITVVDGLTSTSKTAALSANQGRILKELIDNIDVGDINVDLTDYYKKTEVDTLLTGYSKKDHTHTTIGSFTTFNITKSDNSGFPTWMLIADITALQTLTQNGSSYGFTGLYMCRRTGNLNNETGFIVASASWNKDIKSLKSTGSYVRPYIVKYNSKYYIALKLSGSNKDISFWGYKTNLLTEFVELYNTTADTLPAGLEIVTEYSHYTLYNTRVTYDGSGNKIVDTYATKAELTTHTGDTTKHITSTERTNWNTAYLSYHTHSNKSVLDGITTTLISNWNTAYTNNHTHSNKSVLDGITSTKVTNWDGVVTNWDKAFYYDSSGNLRAKVNVIGEKEISAWGAGTSSGTGTITIVDGLTSTSNTAALSANLGRVLRELIDNIDSSGGVDLSGYYNKTEIDTKLNGKADSVHNHTISLVTGLQSALDNKSNTDHKHDNYVDLTTEQTITGRKTFDNGVVINTGNSILDENGWGILGVNPTGWTGLPNDGSAIGLGTGASSVYIRTDGDLYHYNKSDGVAYPIIDSNNISNYKSGDSNKLDGYDLRSNNYTKDTIETKLTYLMDLTDLSTSTFYPVTFSSSPKTLHCEIYSVGGNSSVAYNCNKLGFSFSGQGWSDCPQGLTVHFYSCYSASETTIGCIAMGQEGGVKCVWLRGGVNYYICANQTPTLRTSTYTNGNEKFVTGTSLNGGSNTKVTTYWTPLTTSGLGTLYHSGGIATGGGLSISGNASMAGTLTTTGLATFNGNFSAPAGTTANMVSNSFLFRNGCTINVSKAGWYRFATSITANNSSGNYIFSIRRSYYNTNNESYMMMANVDYNGCNWTLLGGHFNTLLITKIRCTYTNNSTMYFDFYYNGTVANEIFINSIGNCTLQTPTLVTSALSVTNETSLTNGFKTGCKTAYPITIYRNATNGGAYIQYGANNLLTKTWAAGSDTTNSFAWYYKDTSAGTDVCKMKLDPTGILSSDYWLLNNTSTNPYLKLVHTYNSATTNWYLQAYNGYLYMGQGSAKSLRVDSSGNCLSVGEVTAHSDKRLKSDIKPLEVRGELNPVTYIKDGKESIGFIADEVKEVYPELVITDESTDEKYLSLNYAQLTAVLYAEIKELKKEIAELKKKIE